MKFKDRSKLEVELASSESPDISGVIDTMSGSTAKSVGGNEARPVDGNSDASEPKLNPSALERLLLENQLLRASLNAALQKVVQSEDEEERDAYDFKPRFDLGRQRRESITAGFDWNAPQDTIYAHSHPPLEGTLHVFHRQWMGIRAAAGSLPGQKVAIDAHRLLSRVDLKALLAMCEGTSVRKFVFHGMSDSALRIIDQLYAAGLSQNCYVVFHGNVAQWCYPPERSLAFKAIDLARKGRIRKIHFLKRDSEHFLGSRSFGPLLLNMSPKIPWKLKAEGHRGSTVLVPGTDDWRKNLHCNALGAALSPSVKRVLHYASNLALPSPFAKKLERVQYLDRVTTMRLMSICAATLYVSLVECHPMVNLESEAVGTPCLRNCLKLDALEDHPYVKLVEVGDAANPYEIRQVIDRVLTVSRSEISPMIDDYLSALNEEAKARYTEFLEV